MDPRPPTSQARNLVRCEYPFGRSWPREGAGSARRPAHSGPAPPDGLINDSPPAEGRHRQDAVPATAPQVRADLCCLAVVARHRAWSARTLGLRGALIKGASSRCWKRQSISAGRGWSDPRGPGHADQTRLSSPARAAEQSPAQLLKER